MRGAAGPWPSRLPLLARRGHLMLLLLIIGIGFWMGWISSWFLASTRWRDSASTPPAPSAPPEPRAPALKSPPPTASPAKCQWPDSPGAPYPESWQHPYPWLVIGIPTVARATGAPPYLQSTLLALSRQIPKDMGGMIKVVVLHNQPTEQPTRQHPRFEAEREFYKDDDRYEFIETPNPAKVVNGTEVGTADFPGAKVRRQTRDLVNAMRVTQNTFQPEHYMIMEDDFELCPGGLRSIAYMLQRLPRVLGEDWLIARFSFGFNGILMHGKDVPTLASYLEMHQARRPPDHLLVEWFAGETAEARAYKGQRHHGCFRYNLLHHLGIHSTLRGPGQTPNLACFQELKFPLLFEVEVFSPTCTVENPEEDIWPCNVKGRDATCRPLGTAH